MSEGWGDDPEAAVAHLREARTLADEAGRLDEVFRAYANLTTILDLPGRREEAVEAAYEGIEAAREVGQEAVYGNFLRGNAADSLFYLGRWSEARALARTSLEWSPAGIGFVNSAINLAIVEVESARASWPGDSWDSSSSSWRRSATRSTPVRSTAPQRRSHSGGTTWSTPGGRPSSAGRGSATRRTGC